MIHYVYIYLDTRKSGKYIYGDLEFEYEPFYVGQGKNYRCTAGLKTGSPKKKYKIKKIIQDGYYPEVIKLYDNLKYEDALKKEIEIIAKIGRSDINKGPLVNLTDGGEGTLNMSPEIIKKNADNRRGKKMSDEARNNMSKGRRKYFDNGNTTWNKGRSWSEDERKKLTNKSNLGRKFTKEHKDKMSKNAKIQILEGKSILKLTPILQLSLDGKLIKEHVSIISASIETNTNKSGICNCCRNISKTANCFKWEYKNKK
jgi:hypothetical protein